MEDDFYASIKLISGEEIFAKVSASEEDTKTLLLVSDPIVLIEVKTKYGVAYKVEPWMKTTHEDIFVIDMKNVMTMTETYDDEIISTHQKYVNQKLNERDNSQFGINYFKLTREMGYISNINEAKNILEKIYKDL